MAAALYMITGPTGFLVGFVINEITAFVSGIVIKEVLPMAVKVVREKAIEARKRHPLPSGVTPLMSL